jgi:endonuclease YncB( thermonuclease family)
MTLQNAQRRPRSLLRTLADALVFFTLLAMVFLALGRSGWLASTEGEFQVVDGDSLRRNGENYRLEAIDAPELRQTCHDAAGAEYPCGRRAREALHDLVAGAFIRCQILETDRYGRSVAQCRSGATDINGAMVRSGWALAFGDGGLRYAGLEEEARHERRGLWQGSFEAPKAWRDRQPRTPVRGALADAAVEPD